MLQFARSTEYFPLTLTLSLRERESRFRIGNWCLADGRWASSGTGVIERQWAILPLPKGEGRGEGEPSVAHAKVQPVLAADRRRDRPLTTNHGPFMATFSTPYGSR